MKKLQKLQKGDRVAVLSPSFAAPAIFPKIFELGLQRIRDEFGLEPVEYPTTRKLNASAEERACDLIAAFSDPEIKAVIASTGGDDQVTYIHKMSPKVFLKNPKPFLGYSDNSHLCSFLFRHGIPSFYGACVMTQFAMQGEMDKYTVENIHHALFDSGEYEITASDEYNEIGLNWKDETLLTTKRTYEKNMGWVWDAPMDGEGILWGGCLESIDDMLRNNVPIPSLKKFENIVLMLETSEEIPSHGYVRRVIRALGERGVLLNIQGILVGKPKAWEFDKPFTKEERMTYTKGQQEAIIETVRIYNQIVPIIQNINFGHTDPQVPMPYGGKLRIESGSQKIFASF
ncbi:MAG: S66 peptidase family protein [Candidatus Paceibacterota bacterium]|jgi:muramoyltetrapeptide carboxypeptidase LdcA involved in peptidoglycan recycling